MPTRLQRLEIVNCISIDFVSDLESLATLLARSLELLQSLKLHILDNSWVDQTSYTNGYANKIAEHPEHHYCNVVREMGQNIRNLDLRVPYACNRVMKTLPKPVRTLDVTIIDLLPLPGKRAETLSQRVLAKGCRYRRLIFQSICREAHGWDDFTSRAAQQEDNVSWELLYDNEEIKKAMSFVSGCTPVETSLEAAFQSPFESTMNEP